MTANINPIWSGQADVQWGAALATANTAMDGTGTLGTDIISVFTADATNGGYVEKIIAKALGSCAATVIRVFVNNGSTNATVGNNSLIRELGLALTTASNLTALPDNEIPIGFALPAGYRLLVTIGTAVSAGYKFTAVGGKYTA